MQRRKWKIVASIVFFAIYFPSAFARGETNASKDLSTMFPELAMPNLPEMQLQFADGVGGLHEILLNGEVREVFRLPIRFSEVGYNATLKRYIVFEEKYTGKHITIPGETDKVSSYLLSMHHVDEEGTIDKTIPLPVFQRGIGKASFSSNGCFVLVSANHTDRIIKRRDKDNYDACHVEDIYKIDTTTGDANQLLQGACRSLGEIHFQKECFLFTDEHGIICQYNLNDKTLIPLIKGSRPRWNSNGTAVRYTPKIDWFTRKGDTYYPKQTGDDRHEFEYNIETRKKTKQGQAGDRFVWTPDRKYGVRVSHYDKLFTGKGLGKVILESSDMRRKALLTSDIKFPSSIFWISR